MQQDNNEIWIMSVLELKICMYLAGCEEWNYFPVMYSPVPLEQRIIQSFLNLADMGFLKKEQEKYAPTEKLEAWFQKMAVSECVLQVLGKNRMPILYAVNGRHAVAVEQVSVQNESVRIYNTDIAGILCDMTEHKDMTEETTDHFEKLSLEEKQSKAKYVLRLSQKDRQRLAFIWRKGEKMMLSVQNGPTGELTADTLAGIVEGDKD